ncbi:MAG TPA: GNAT family N-acetyltransferase [Kofleriaceae bacterium]|jgi:CelD/BcsL family acetyltransferase involved in cellulose biosynthesis|nr:GNAT family N-acetyltransferase [Kofleriaceae bacterium]
MMFELDTIPLAERSRIRGVWCALEAASPPPYFLSWAWVETWLDSLPPSADVALCVARRAGAPVAAFFLGTRTRWRHRVLRSRELHWNMTGHAAYDEICIEYNGMVHDGTPPPLAEIVARLPGAWDEVYLPALDADGPVARGLAGLSEASLRVRTESRVPAPTVDLARVRDGGDYLKLLGGSTRSQIRRSQKLYGARGKLALEVAASPQQAAAVFDELVDLHRRAWRDRGEAGAFVPFVHAFHRRLIERRFAAGEIQLLRVRAGDTTVGCLYNFVWRGDVLFYQSGLAYETDGKLKPGLVCHALAVDHAARAGHRWYDFLAGQSRYKQSLATDARALVWARIQKPRLRFALEDLARQVRDHVRARRAQSAAAASPAPAPAPAAADDA